MASYFMKGTLLLFTVLCAQIAWYRLHPPPPSPCLLTAKQVLSTQPKIVFFGDSILTATSEKDSDPRPLKAMIQAELGATTIEFVNHPAWAAEVFAGFTYHFAKAGFTPSITVVPINLRSFSPSFHSRPEWQFVKDRAELSLATSPLLIPFLNPLMVFKFINPTPISEGEWKSMPVLDGTTPVGTVADFSDEKSPLKTREAITKKFVWSYLNSFAGSHPKVAALRELSTLARKNSSQVVFYVSPIDMETGVSVLGERFKAQIGANVNVVAGAAREVGAEFRDFSALVGSDGFKWREENIVSEHMNEKGRRTLAYQLTEQLKGLIQVDRSIANGKQEKP